MSAIHEFYSVHKRKITVQILHGQNIRYVIFLFINTCRKSSFIFKTTILDYLTIITSVLNNDEEM